MLPRVALNWGTKWGTPWSAMDARPGVFGAVFLRAHLFHCERRTETSVANRMARRIEERALDP